MTPDVAACQIAVSDLDVSANHGTIRKRVESLPDTVDLAAFPEYALTGFVAEERVADAALDAEGDVLTELGDLATGEDTAIVVGFLERSDDALYNTLAYLSSEGDPAFYRKRHLWDREAAFVESGGERVTVETPAGTAGLLTCYDLNFVEESAAFTEERIDLLLVPGAWPAAYSENWRLLLRARALDGVRWVVGAGRTGESEVGDRAREYAGRSLVARPDGGVRAELDRREDDLVVDLDSEVRERQRDLVGIFEE